jgi:hypothetical protein
MSINNIMIYTPTVTGCTAATTAAAATEDGIRRGMIIDLDYALDMNAEEAATGYILNTKGEPVELGENSKAKRSRGHRTVSSISPFEQTFS